MKIYLAGSCATKERMLNWHRRINNRLLSFYELKEGLFCISYAFRLIKGIKE